MTKLDLLDTYEINPLTMAIVAETNDSKKKISLVLESESEFYVELSPTTIVERSCAYFGSSLRGRQEGTKDISGITHKAPISIAPSSGMYFCPTASPTNPQCSWISHTHVKKVGSAKHQCAEIEFVNGKKIILDVSVGSMMNQIHKTAQFRYLLDERIKSISNNKNDPDLKR